MIDIVKDTIARRGMLKKGDRVAVGLSGGADSVSLLSVLLELAPELELTVRAVHINHGIRGESADRDQQFCAQLCDSLGVKLDCFTYDIPAIAAKKGIGLEQCGRECRYECFDRIAKEHGCRIATAHTLSDSAETVLFNLTRGSGLGGVCGIPPVRDNIIRPLIGVTRAQVEEYCEKRGLEYVTDETNADTAYSRNLIRKEVVPALERVNPAMHRAFARFTDCAREDADYLDSVAEQALSAAFDGSGWSCEALDDLHPAILRRAVMLIAATAGAVPEYSQTELCAGCIKNRSGAVVIRNDARFSVRRGIITMDSAEPTPTDEQWCVPLTLPETPLPDGRVLRFTQIDVNDQGCSPKNRKYLFKNALDCDIINRKLYVRNRREGDRFAPSGRGVSRLLKKFLCDEKVPREKRGTLTLIASEDSVLWVEGFGCSETGKPAEGSDIVYIPEISGKENQTEDNQNEL